ncbi:MAG: ABC transporter permease [Bacilli bacterium]|nr:ABC transporter permease [Bacilli bacterium]
MRNILITIKKELRSIFRDKKTVISMFIYPILIPCMVLLYGTMGDNLDEDAVSGTIGVNYSLSEPEKAILKEMKMEYNIYDSEDAMNRAFKDKEISGYVTQDGKKYTIYYDESSTEGMVSSEMIVAYLEAYNNYLTSEYLVEKGINVEEAYNQISYDTKSLETRNYMTTVLLSVSLTYTILAICISASNMAILTTATEKENGTLETILTFPIEKGELITGKYASSVIVGFIASLISFALMTLSFYFGTKTFKTFEGVSLNVNLYSVIGSLVTCFLASVFISGIAMYLTAFAKSYKEAQGKISLINMIGIFPIFITLLNINITNSFYLIPICNYVQIINDLLIGKMEMTNLLITFGSTIVYTVAIVKLIIKLYNSEKILFSN